MNLRNVVVDAPSGLDRRGYGGEVVVGEDHGGRLAGHVGARAAHRHADVGPAQRGRVVDAVAGHGDDLALGAQRVGDPELGLRRAAREHHLGSRAEQLVEFLLGHHVELGPVDHVHPVGADADAAGDRGCGQPVVPGDHVDADARLVHPPDRGRDLGARRVEHRHQPDQAQVPFRLLPLAGNQGAGRERPAAEREHPQALPRVIVHEPRRGGLVRGRDRRLVRAAADPARPGEDLLGRALSVHHQAAVQLIDGGHELDPRIEPE